MDINSVIRWFDPNASSRATVATAYSKTKPGPPPVWLQYLAFSLGILGSPLIYEYRAKGSWPEFTVGWFVSRIAFSLITGFIAFPQVIDSLAKPDASRLARLSTLFTAGLGWEQLSGLPPILGGKA